MSKRVSTVIVAAALSLVGAVPAAAAAAPSTSDQTTATYIVQFTPGADHGQEVAKARGLGMTVVADFTLALDGMAVEANAGQLTALQRNPNISLVEASQMASIDETQTGATWGIDRIDQRSLSLSGTYTYSTTASNVTAYVIDTGIRADHSQFGGRVDTAAGFDAMKDGNEVDDCNGHGTHVAGTIGGSAYGVAKGVRLVPIRVLGCDGTGSDVGIISAIEHIMSTHGTEPAVANMSLGFGAPVASVDTAVNSLVNGGVTVVAAAGNSNANACNSTPGRVPSAITVGATTSTDARAYYSNYGSCLDVFAPGSSITSAWYTSATAKNTISGTSMASPHVAGAAALYLAGHPTAAPATVASALTDNATTGKVTSPGAGSPNRLLFVGVDAPAAKPAIGSLTPATGPVDSTVVIGGSGFTGATHVAFNGTLSVEYTVNSDAQITAIVPNAATSGLVSVTTASGSTTSIESFIVTTASPPAAPTEVTAISPSKGRAAVRWALTTNNGGSPVTSQTVVAYRLTGTPTRTTYTVSSTATSVTLSLTRRAQYQFAVIASNAAGPSAESVLSASLTIR